MRCGDCRQSSKSWMRCTRWRSCCSLNTMPTEMPCSSRWAYTLWAACRQCSSWVRRSLAACCAAGASAPSASTACLSTSSCVGNWWKWRPWRAWADMRTRTSEAKPVALTWPTQKVSASSSVTSQPLLSCSSASVAGANSTACTRSSCSGGRASSQSLSEAAGSSRPNSSARSVVSGVPGSTLRRRRWPSSLRKAVRGAKPKSASMGAMSTSRRKARHQACQRSNHSGRALAASSSSCTRATLAALSLPWPRTQASSPISHRWRWASGASGSSAVSRSDRSGRGGLMNERGRAVVAGCLSATRAPVRPRPGHRAQRRALQPRSVRHLRPRRKNGRASAPKACAAACRWCTGRIRRV